MTARIAVDAMGGDHAPGAIIRGAVEALSSLEGAELTLVGWQDAIRNELERITSHPGAVRIVHAPQTVDMDESPTEAIRRKKDSSLMVMTRLAAEGEVDAIISAGNTGALAAAAQLRMGLLPGVVRPGIAVTLPTFHGPVVLCDVGANIQAKPQHLYQYALMATLFAEKVLGAAKPRVGLVSIGEENRKGTEVVKQTHEMLHQDRRIAFVGNVEGRELFQNRCDVAVCDGFVGNVLLKFIEGVSEALFATISREFRDEEPSVQQRFEAAIKRVWARYDYSEYGGAPLLGIDGVCIVCHGRSEERAIRNAVRAACSFVHLGFSDAIVERLGGDASVSR